MRAEGGLRTEGRGKVFPGGRPVISVITVVFNGKKHIEQTIQSVLEQVSDNIEYIIIDGGSTDGTVDAIRNYSDRIDYWVTEPDRGIYDAMNKGIGVASGELVGFLNSDDWYASGALEEVVKAYARENTVIAGEWNLVFEDINLTIKASPSLKFHRGMPLSHQAMFVPKAVYDSVGNYDLRYRYAADLEMALRLCANRVGFLFLDKALVNFRVTGASEKHYRESGKEASEIAKRYLPYGTYCLFRVIRLKYELLNAFSRGLEAFAGKNLSGFLRKRYYGLKTRVSGNWKIP